MKEEKEILWTGMTIGLVAITIGVEVVMTWVLIWLNTIPTIVRGYFGITWVFIVAWLVLSILWIGLMYTFISKKRRRGLTRVLTGGK